MMFGRRDFISSLGGLVAASALPSFAKDDPSLFAGRGAYERLVLSYQHVHIGLAKPFSILHISDTHLTESDGRDMESKREFAEKRRRTFGGRQQAALASSLAWAKGRENHAIATRERWEKRRAKRR